MVKKIRQYFFPQIKKFCQFVYFSSVLDTVSKSSLKPYNPRGIPNSTNGIISTNLWMFIQVSDFFISNDSHPWEWERDSACIMNYGSFNHAHTWLPCWWKGTWVMGWTLEGATVLYVCMCEKTFLAYQCASANCRTICMLVELVSKFDS